MKKLIPINFILFLVLTPALSIAEDKIELKTTFIKGNKELPQILYVVPWQDSKRSKSDEQYIVLHSLFGDFFEPVKPGRLSQ